MKFFKQQKGFTLVELLVVLAIVGILIGLAVAGIRIVQAVNRDTQRKAFISKDLQLVLEGYQEKMNKYPTAAAIQFSKGAGGCASGETYIAAYTTTAGVGTVIEKTCSKVSFDLAITSTCPASFTGEEAESGKLTFCYEGTSKGYKLNAKLERNSTPYNASNVD